MNSSTQREILSLSRILDKYDLDIQGGVVMIRLSDYNLLVQSLYHSIGPLHEGPKGGVLLMGNEFLPMIRSTRMQLKLTEHCKQRAAEMGVPTKKIKRILDNAEVDAPSGRGEGYRIASVDNISVPYTLDGHAITVLWRGEEDRDAPGQGIRVGKG